MVCGTLLAAAALSLPAAQRASAQPYDPPPTVPLSQLLTQLQTYYRQTETVTEAYNKAKETADQQRTKARQIDRQLADQRVAVADSRTRLGLMASQMYRDGGVSPYLSLLAGQSPQDFFGQRHVLGQLAGRQQDALGDLTSGETRLKALNTQAQHALDKAEHAQGVAAARTKDVASHLHQVEGMLAGLTGVQIDELQALEQSDADKAQQGFMDAKSLGADPALRAPSQVGDRAIGYAFQQLGKPYVWGAQGPASFDCSGLTSQAWAHAGVPIARTSQEQWATLPHVPLSLLRPGDLVVYFPGATHVALYIGDGLVVQAPRPGASVKVSPIAANPILGAVRPDLGKKPLTDYMPRAIPKGAQGATPIGIAPPTRE
jgi:cell wall-associated NlpC family hydrolase